MSQPVISVEGLGKRYYLSHQKRQDTLRDSLTHGARRFFQRFTRPEAATTEDEEFWALRDLEFNINQGDVVGIIGRNGAGKSTLLKILSRITEPTTGRATIRGRVASLLEVGTGFHPELTGRENIFLNGAILGMSRAEITRKFDEIVAFAEVERFLDTQVKHYSSGMYVRLAFSVAAHLEPEILIVDEVLAVGDAQFQKKCLGKMSEVARDSGRTILFVSHNISVIRNLCTRGLFLENGRLHLDAGIESCVNAYLERSTAATADASALRRSGDGRIQFTCFRIEDPAGEPLNTVPSGTDAVLVFTYRNFSVRKGQVVDVGFGLHAPTGERLLLLYASQVRQEFHELHETGEFRCRLPALPLATGRYFLYPRLEVGGIEADFPQNGFGWIDVEECDYFGTGQIMGPKGHAPYLLKGEWSERPETPAAPPSSP